MGTQGSGALKPYLVDHTILTLEGHSKPSPADILGEDWRRETWEGAAFVSPHLLTPASTCPYLPYLPGPLPRSPSMAFSIPFSP